MAGSTVRVPLAPAQHWGESTAVARLGSGTLSGRQSFAADVLRPQTPVFHLLHSTLGAPESLQRWVLGPARQTGDKTTP
jgi:hypothetical protein